MTSKLLQPIQVGNLTFKNRIMFPPLTTGYEERDGSIGPRSLAFYTRLAKVDVPILLLVMWLLFVRQVLHQNYMMNHKLKCIKNWQMPYMNTIVK